MKHNLFYDDKTWKNMVCYKGLKVGKTGNKEQWFLVQSCHYKSNYTLSFFKYKNNSRRNPYMNSLQLTPRHAMYMYVVLENYG